MKPVETFTLTAAEAQARGLHPITQAKSNYAAVMSCGGKIVMYEWFAQYTSATVWALERSVWKYNP
jgi:hypothetical protein